MTMADRYRRWYVYERDAHQKVRRSLEGVAPELRGEAWFQKAVDLFAHMMAARHLWLFRFGIEPDRPSELFPRGVALATLGPLIADVEHMWSTYFEGLADDEVARVFEYTSTEGLRFRNTVEDVLTQLFGHSLYHRGQIAQLLRSGGAEPPITDFVFWAREALD
jgi:uncharacterized damage-inducible protein DinB